MTTVKGKDVSITFNAKKCIHARNCVLSQPDIFKAGVEGQWIFPDAGDVEDIVVLAQGCPSGAIEYERHDGGKNEPKPRVNTARILENGPIAIKANIEMDGTPMCNRLTLCRCGHSKNKPYCDGSHSEASFVATGDISIVEADPLSERNGVLKVTPATDGPLIVEGNLEILCGGGTKSAVTTKTALCRCGASANKPYCDGSHVKMGFKS